jgi:hypothetical protein
MQNNRRHGGHCSLIKPTLEDSKGALQPFRIDGHTMVNPLSSRLDRIPSPQAHDLHPVSYQKMN